LQLQCTDSGITNPKFSFEKIISYGSRLWEKNGRKERKGFLSGKFFIRRFFKCAAHCFSSAAGLFTAESATPKVCRLYATINNAAFFALLRVLCVQDLNYKTTNSKFHHDITAKWIWN
jgi:hypothetical protein